MKKLGKNWFCCHGIQWNKSNIEKMQKSGMSNWKYCIWRFYHDEIENNEFSVSFIFDRIQYWLKKNCNSAKQSLYWMYRVNKNESKYRNLHGAAYLRFKSTVTLWLALAAKIENENLNPTADDRWILKQ